MPAIFCGSAACGAHVAAVVASPSSADKSRDGGRMGGLVPSRGFSKPLLEASRRLVTPTMASAVDSAESSATFAKRMERAWLISKQPRPIACSSCQSTGYVECKWCAGTGFFILGNNMLCEVPSKNTKCLICAGKGSACCADCKGTGFRAKWLEEPPVNK